MRAPRTLGWLALIPFMYSACASTRPSPPPSVDRKAFGLEIALCEAAAKPSAGDYAMAAGIGLVAPVATPLLFLGGVFGLTERSPLPPPPPRDSREDGRGAAAVAAGLATLFGVIAAPYVTYVAVDNNLRDARQSNFIDCLAARGVRPRPASGPPRVLLVHDPSAPGADLAEPLAAALVRQGYVPDKTIQLDVRTAGEIDMPTLVIGGWRVVVVSSLLDNSTLPSRIGHARAQRAAGASRRDRRERR